MTNITLDQANHIIQVTLATARGMELPPLGVAVLDVGGHLIALQREDGLSFLRVRICQAKAYGALGMGVDSAALAARYEGGPAAAGFVNAVQQLCSGMLVPVPGGVLVRNSGQTVVGVVGVSGAKSEDDAICAKAGIKAAGFDCS